MNKFLACLIIMTIMAAFSPAKPCPLLAQNNQETLMLFAPQADDPIHIVQASFGANNLLLDARLENRGHQKIQTYRLGWAVVKKEDVRMTLGEMMSVPEGVDTSAAFDVPAQGVPKKEDLSKHPTGIVFYVAELQFQDGSRWQIDPKKIKKEVSGMVK